MSDRVASRFQPEDMQLLAWKFLDGCATDAEQRQLAGCLNEDEAARGIYLQCVQLHVDLLAHFGSLPTPKVIEKGTTPTSAKPAMPVVVSMVSPLPLMTTPLPF